MTYEVNVKKELDAILKAFDTYIEEQSYFDIVYSKKAGYLWMVVDSPGAAIPEQLETPEDMLDLLFNEVINDVIDFSENKTQIPDAHTLSEWEEAESRRRIAAILETIEIEGDDCLDYLDYLDAYLKEYQERCSEDRET